MAISEQDRLSTRFATNQAAREGAFLQFTHEAYVEPPPPQDPPVISLLSVNPLEPSEGDVVDFEFLITGHDSVSWYVAGTLVDTGGNATNQVFEGYFPDPGTYSFSLIARNEDESTTYSGSITVTGGAGSPDPPTISLVGYEPNPITEGDDFTIYVNVENGNITSATFGGTPLQIDNASNPRRLVGTAPSAGTYQVAATVEGPGGSKSAQTNFTVEAGAQENRPPVADFNFLRDGLTVEFDASVSSDPDNDDLTYEWDFGDEGSDIGVDTTHVYAEAGTYTVTLVVSDGNLSDTIQQQVTVTDQTVVDTFVYPSLAERSQPARLEIPANAYDLAIERPQLITPRRLEQNLDRLIVWSSTILIAPIAGVAQRSGIKAGHWILDIVNTSNPQDATNEWVRVSTANHPSYTFNRSGLKGMANRPRWTSSPLLRDVHGILDLTGIVRSVTISIESGSDNISQIGQVYGTYSTDGTVDKDSGNLVLYDDSSGEAVGEFSPYTRAFFLYDVLPADQQGVQYRAYASVNYIPTVFSPVDATVGLMEAMRDNSSVLLPNITKGEVYFNYQSIPIDYEGLMPSNSFLIGHDVFNGYDAQTGEPSWTEGSALRTWPGEYYCPIAGADQIATNNLSERGNGQQGMTLANMHIYGQLFDFDVFNLWMDPGEGAFLLYPEGVHDLVVNGCTLLGGFDDDMKIGNKKLVGFETTTNPTFATVPADVSAYREGFYPDAEQEFKVADFPFSEGMVSLKDPDTADNLSFEITIPGDPDPAPQLYGANAVTEDEGLMLVARKSQYVEAPSESGLSRDDQRWKVVAYIDTIRGWGWTVNGFTLPAGATFHIKQVDVEACDNPTVVNCVMVGSGRNNFTLTSHRGTFTFQHNSMYGASQLGRMVGVLGAFAADVQAGTTARNDYELWEQVIMQDNYVSGLLDSVLKVGQEQGFRYDLGENSLYQRNIFRGGRDKTVKTASARLGPVIFRDNILGNIDATGFSLDSFDGTLLLNNQYQANDGYNALVGTGKDTRNVTINGEVWRGPEGTRGILAIGGYGETILNCERMEIIVSQPKAAANYTGPPTEVYRGTDCYYDLAAGTRFDLYNDGNLVTLESDFRGV